MRLRVHRQGSADWAWQITDLTPDEKKAFQNLKRRKPGHARAGFQLSGRTYWRRWAEEKGKMRVAEIRDEIAGKGASEVDID